MDRTLKMLFIEGSVSLVRPTIPDLWKLLVFGLKKKQHKHKETLKIFSLGNKSFYNLHKVLKSTVLNIFNKSYK